MFLGVTGSLLGVTEEEMRRLAAVVERERERRGWGKEQAARLAKISSITWKRVEDAKRVQPAKLRAMETAFDWPAGVMEDIAAGNVLPPPEPPSAHDLEDTTLVVPWSDQEMDVHTAVLSGSANAMSWISLCSQLGTPERQVSPAREAVIGLVQAAVAHLNDLETKGGDGADGGPAATKTADDESASIHVFPAPPSPEEAAAGKIPENPNDTDVTNR